MGLTFIIWTFLASILLKVEDRYIGISFTALSIGLSYLYINDVLKWIILITVIHRELKTLLRSN